MSTKSSATQHVNLITALKWAKRQPAREAVEADVPEAPKAKRTYIRKTPGTVPAPRHGGRRMNIISRAIAAIAGYVGYQKAYPVGLQGVNDRGWISWWMGHPATDFQNDIEVRQDQVMAQSTVFACMTLIAATSGNSSQARRAIRDRNLDETESPAFSPVLRKPNRYQTRQKFIEQWIVTKLASGNAYILKQRDARRRHRALHPRPELVTPLVANDGEVYYQLHRDDLSQVPGGPAGRAGERDHPRPHGLPLPPAGRRLADLRLRPGRHAGV